MIKYLYLLLCLTFLTVCSSGVYAQIITTYAGNGFGGHTGDGGPATAATLDTATYLASDAAGNLYINEERNYCVRLVTPAGTISTIAGKDSIGFTGDGGPATNATFQDNWGISLSAGGDLYITDAENHRVRKVSPAIGGTISTFAGTGVYGNTGDGGPASAARMRSPLGIATDNAGNIFIADQSIFGIRKVDASGTITHYAGIGSHGFGGDGGQATNAQFGYIYGIATDIYGNLYVCDGDNNRVRMINSAGVITTIAGNGFPAFGGDGGPAVLASIYHPTGVYVTRYGDVYIADCYNNRIRKINTSGIISTFAGTGFAGFFGDGGPAINAKLFDPVSITMDINEDFYVSDMANDRIRKISKSLAFTGGHFQSLTICENTVAAPLNGQLTIIDHNTGMPDLTYIVSGPSNGYAVVAYSTTATGSPYTPSGVYYTPTFGFYGSDTLRVGVSDGIATDTTTIYINVIPGMLTAGTITGASTVCKDASIVLTDSVAGGSWTTANGNATVLGMPLSCQVTGLHPGTDTVFYTVSNSCGTAMASKIITVNDIPDPGTIYGPAAVCIGSSITLSDSIPGGVWTASNTHATVNTGVVKGLTAGPDTIIYTVNNTLCKASAAYKVQVDTFPYAGIISGPSAVCVGDSITLTDSVPGGRWNSADSVLLLDAGAVTGVASGTGTVSYTVSNSCGSAYATFPVTVGKVPDIPQITQTESVFYAPTGYSSYQWTLDGIPIPGATADSYLATVKGAYSVIVTNTSGCSTNSLSQTYIGCSPDDIVVYPNPAEALVYIRWCRKVNIWLLAADGKLITKMRDTDEIDLTGLPNAVYIISIHDKNDNYIKSKRVTKLTQ